MLFKRLCISAFLLTTAYFMTVYLSPPAIAAVPQARADKDIALVKAVKAHNLRRVKELLRQGANANYLDNAIFSSVRLTHIDQHRADLLHKQQRGTPILISVLQEPKEHSDIVRALLTGGANPNSHSYNQAEDTEGVSALFLAYTNHYWHSMKLLLDYGANPNSAWYPDHPYYYPLNWVANDNNAQVAKLLLDHGAKINRTDNWGYTALMVAANDGNEVMVRLLLRRKADPNFVSKDNEHTTALRSAQQEGHERIVQLLLRYGAK